MLFSIKNNLSKLGLFAILTLLITPLTSALTSGEGTIIFGSISSIIILAIFFLLIAIIINNNALKVFFISLSALSILFSVGYGVIVIEQFFPTFNSIVNAYSSFYILLAILTGAGALALIVWLVVIAFQTFYEMRGLSKEE